MSNLAAVWHQVEALLSAGISVIPVRDKEALYHGRILKPKVPFSDWKTYQTQLITKDQLWHDMEAHNTSAVAMVCGAVSGNLEAIDIDVKFQPGIDAQLFAAIGALYPDIGRKLRIQRSPSGGAHIIYKCEGEVAGNQQLACRPASDQELAANSKRKKFAVIETRGEGGYIMCPPSLGYRVIRNEVIQTLTVAERASLLELCRTFNTYIKPPAPAYTPPASNDYYDLDPWTDFSQRCDAVALLEGFGWQRVQSQGASSDKLYFTRPGGTKGDTHGTFSQSLRTFYVYSSNTGLDPDRAYNLGTLLAFYQFGTDKKRTYAYLVAQGYGRIRAHVEARIVKQKAQKSKPLPANASEEARANYQEVQIQAEQDFPYGIFWARDDEDKMRISREGIYAVAQGLGFRMFQQEVIQIGGCFIYDRSERYFYDTLKSYIRDDDPEELEEILNAYEAFLQKSGTFTLTRIPELGESEILHDTADTCYKYYLNGYVTIQQSGYVFTPYTSQLPALIWYKEVQQREWKPKPLAEPRYLQYLKLAIRYELNPVYFQKIIGYLAHSYKDETTGFIVILTEESVDPKQGGGSGKNVWCSLLKLTTTVKNIPASQVTFDEKFLQYWNGERILTVSDSPKDLDLAFFKELSTGSGLVKKLYKNQQEVPCRYMPKFVIQTNHSFEVSDGGLRRRLIPVEFTDFFTQAGGVDVHFGCFFPDGWAPDDWTGFDHFIAECVQQWLIGERKLRPIALSTSGWRKQFEQEFGVMTTQFIEENWDKWVVLGEVKVIDFNQSYNDFCLENGIGKFRASSFKMNNALFAYAKHKDCAYIPNHVIRDGFSTIKAKKFLGPAPF